MKKLKIIEIISSISALLSKILLATDSIFGWPLGLIGYVLVAIYNFIRKDTLLAITVVGLSFMCLYGWYKWSISLNGLLLIDYVILTATALFGLYVYVKTARKSGLMGHLQGLITVSTISAFIMLGYKILLGGWVALLISHIMLAYFYNKRKAKYYVTLQIISMIIAGIKIYKLIV